MSESSTDGIALPRSGLYVRNGALVRQEKGKPNASEISLGSIQDVSVRMEANWVGLLFPAGLFVIAWACKWFIPSANWGWLAAIVCVVAGVLFVLGIYRPILTVKTAEGTARFELQDSEMDAEAFALSLRQQAGVRKAA